LDSGEIAKWERQVKVRLEVNGKLVCTMVPDFQVWDLRNKPFYVEVKGWPTPIYRLKLKLFRALYPEASYFVITSKEALAL
jgi:hypothetical protein